MIENFVPEETIISLDHIQEQFSRLERKTIEITHQIITWLEKSKSDIVCGRSTLDRLLADQLLALGRMDVYAFVADHIGKKLPTVRRWYRVVDFMQIDVWDKAIDILPFSTLYTAAQYEGNETKVLNIAMKYLERYGKPMKVSMLEQAASSVLSSNVIGDAVEILLSPPDLMDMDSTFQEIVPQAPGGVSYGERLVLSELRRVIYAAVKVLPETHWLYSAIKKIYDELNEECER